MFRIKKKQSVDVTTFPCDSTKRNITANVIYGAEAPVSTRCWCGSNSMREQAFFKTHHHIYIYLFTKVYHNSCEAPATLEPTSLDGRHSEQRLE